MYIQIIYASARMWNLWHNVYFIKILTHCFWPKTNQHFPLALSYRLMGTAIPRRKNKPITQNWTSQHPFLEQARLQTKQAHGWCWRSRSLLCLYFSHYVGSKHFKTRFAFCFYAGQTFSNMFQINAMILNSPNSPRCHWIIITIRHIHQCCKSLQIY